MSTRADGGQEYLESQFRKTAGKSFVVVTDTHFPDNYEIYCVLADHLRNQDVVLVLVTECVRPERDNVVNVHIGRVSGRSPTDAQRNYPFSLFKPLVCERSITDFCTFRKEEIYSRVPFERFLHRYMRFIAAYEFLFSRGGIFVGMLHDTFKSAVASRIAEYHSRPVLLPIQYYWWPDAVLFFDTANQNSREVEARYNHYMAHPELLDSARAESIYARKARTFISNAEPGNTLFSLVGHAWRSRKSPEPFSFMHFLRRRTRRLAASLSGAIRPNFLTDYASVAEGFVLFPLHVAPEASILGAAPELADQFSMIKNVAMNLPLGMLLLVKEHPDQHRARLGAQFYTQLASIPNVRLIHASVSARDLIRMPQCAAVVVINGTLGIEAAYEGKRVFVPPRGAAWYSFCGAFDIIHDWEDVFAALLTGGFVSRRREVLALILAMDDCVEPIDVVFAGPYSFREAGQACMHAAANKIAKVARSTVRTAAVPVGKNARPWA